MHRILIVAATTGYQTRSFDEAATSLGAEIVYATDRCKSLADPWRDGAIPIKFADPHAAADAIVERLADRPVDGVIGLGDRPAYVASCAAMRLGIPFHAPQAVSAAIHKVHTRGRLLGAGLRTPWFVSAPVDAPFDAFADRMRFPCVVKPVHLSASRGVMRANDVAEFERARQRLAALLERPDVVREGGQREILVEGFIPGQEYALDGVLDRGALKVFAIFAKPDPLDGPFFEETIYVTPPGMPEATERLIAGTVAHAATALGLSHGPVHAECRVNTEGVFVLEIAPRPIGGLCGRALRFRTRDRDGLSFEQVLLRFALGDPLEGYGREAAASGVMMVPIPARGRYRGVDGLDEARALEGVRDVVVTATPGQYVEPLPEGHSYLGFVFAEGDLPEQAVARLREAHARLRFTFDRDLARGPAYFDLGGT